MKIFKYGLIALIACVNYVYAQQADTTKKVFTANSVRYVQLKDFHTDTLTFRSLDTSAFGFQNFNPIHADNVPRFYLGNLGLAYKSFLIEEENDFGFIHGKKAHDIYMKSIDDIQYYRVFSPYTKLYYIWNRRKEQYFNFTFAQNIGPRFNYTMNFSRLVSLGDYNRQVADHLNYDLSLWYTDKSRRYQVNAAIINNNLSIQENGGIQNDSIFLKDSEINSEFEPVFLNNATNRISDKQYFVRQSYAFGKKEEFVIDSLTISRIRPKFRLFHELRIQNRKDEYRETPLDSGVYANIFYDSTNTADIVQFLKLENRVGFEFFKLNTKSKRYHLLSAYLSNTNVDYSNLSLDTVLNSTAIVIDGKYQLARNIELNGNFKQGIQGDFADNNYLGINARYYFKSDSNFFELGINNRKNEQAFYFNRYESNHFRFNNSFADKLSNSIQLRYVNIKRNFSAGISLRNIQNDLYIDSNSNLQLIASYNYTQLYFQKLFRLGKFYLNNVVYLQENTSNNLVRVPLLHTYQSIYFQSYVFKKALFLRTGFDVRYYTKTEAYQYNAALQAFQLDKVSLGDYPIIDFFITAGLKRAVLMVKVDHMNQGFWNRGSAYVRNYPLPDRAVKVGVRWNFYD